MTIRQHHVQKTLRHLIPITVIVLLSFAIFSSVGFALAKKPVPTESKVATQSEPSSFSLLDCYQLALKRSETIAMSKESIEEAEANIFLSTSELLGDVDLLLTHFKQDAPTTSGETGVGRTLSARDRKEGKFVVTQPLFQGFRSIAALGAAGSFKRQRKEERVRAEQLLFRDVARAFYTVLKQEKDVEIVEEIHKTLEERIKELDEREKIGRSRPSEVATAVSRLKLVEFDLAHSKGALAISLHILEFLLGRPINPNELKDTNTPSNPTFDSEVDEWLSEARPDVQASKYAAKTAWRGVIEAQSNLWPKISLESNRFIHREGFQKDIDWDVLFKVDVPLSRGGETVGNIKKAVSVWKKTKLNYSLTKRQAALDMKETYQNWLASRDGLKAMNAAVEASQKNFDLQKEDYARNLVSNLDVLVALEEFYNTQRELNRARYDVKQNYWELQIAKGILNESI